MVNLNSSSAYLEKLPTMKRETKVGFLYKIKHFVKKILKALRKKRSTVQQKTVQQKTVQQKTLQD